MLHHLVGVRAGVRARRDGQLPGREDVQVAGQPGVREQAPGRRRGSDGGRCCTPWWAFARVYAHAGMVSYQGEKMSKSLGNLVFVNRLLADGVDPMAVRMALLEIGRAH